MNITEFFITPEECEEITNFVYKEKNNWTKNLNNVKSLTSGFSPDYDFLHNIGKHCCNEVLPKLTKFHSWKKSCWWVNFYEPGHYTHSHVHIPEEYSMIIIVKPSLGSYCLKFETEYTKYMVEEKQGLCLLFESSLAHSVEPVKSDRITIAMDFVKNQ